MLCCDVRSLLDERERSDGDKLRHEHRHKEMMTRISSLLGLDAVHTSPDVVTSRVRTVTSVMEEHFLLRQSSLFSLWCVRIYFLCPHTTVVLNYFAPAADGSDSRERDVARQVELDEGVPVERRARDEGEPRDHHASRVGG